MRVALTSSVWPSDLKASDGVGPWEYSAPYPKIDITSPTFTVQALDSASEKFAQSFLVTESFSATGVGFYAQKVGGPNATLKYSIQSDASGAPSGTELASGTVSLATLPAAGGLRHFTFGTATSLTAGTTYWIVVEYSSVTTIDASNYYGLYMASGGNAYANGVYKVYDGASWGSAQASDLISRVLATGPCLHAFARAGTDRLVMWRSGDYGLTWYPYTLLGSGLTTDPTAQLALSGDQSGANVYLAMADLSTIRVYVAKVDLSLADPENSVILLASQPGSTATLSDSSNLQKPLFLRVRSNGDIALFRQGPTARVMGVDYRRIYLDYYTASTTTWAAPVEVSGVASANNADARYLFRDSDDRLWFFYIGVSAVPYVKVMASGSSTLGSEVTTNATVARGGPVVEYLDGATKKLKVAGAAGTGGGWRTSIATLANTPTFSAATNEPMAGNELEDNTTFTSNPGIWAVDASNKIWSIHVRASTDTAYISSAATVGGALSTTETRQGGFAPIIVDSTGTSSVAMSGVGIGSNDAIAQSFTTTSEGGRLEALNVYLAKVGSPTDYLYAEVWSGSTPGGGTLLATSEKVSCASLSTSAAYVPFYFWSPATLSASTGYHLVFKRTVADASNYPLFYTNTANPYAGGSFWQHSVSGGTWTEASTWDMRISVGSTFTVNAIVGRRIGDVIGFLETSSNNALFYGEEMLVGAPTLSNISPTSGAEAGGTSVTLTGTNFSTGRTRVMFGSLDGVNEAVASATSMTAESPAGTGSVSVKVLTPAGASGGQTFTYASAGTNLGSASGSAVATSGNASLTTAIQLAPSAATASATGTAALTTAISLAAGATASATATAGLRVPGATPLLARRRSGTVSFTSTDSVKTVDLTADPISDITKTILLATHQPSATGGNAANSEFIAHQISDASTLSFQRNLVGGGSSAPVVHYTLLEFTGDVEVQRGQIGMDDTGTGQNLDGTWVQSETINAVDTSKSFVLWSFRNGGSVFGSDDFVDVQLRNATTMHARLALAGTSNGVVEYQVVQFGACSVQRVNGIDLSNNSSWSFNLASAIEADNSFVILGFRCNPSDINNSTQLYSATLTDTQVLVARATTSTYGTTGSYQVVTFSNATTVRRGSTTITNGTASTTGSVSPAVDDEKSAYLTGGLYGKYGKSDYTADDNVGAAGGSATINTAGDTLTFTRGQSLGSATWDWQVIEFEAASTALGSAPGAGLATGGAGLTTAISLAPSASAVAAATAALTTAISLTAAAAGTASATASLTSAIALLPAGAGQASASADLTTAIPLVPQAAGGVATGAASLTTQIQLVAPALAVAASTGALTTAITVAAAGAALATGGAEVTVPASPLLEVGGAAASAAASAALTTAISLTGAGSAAAAGSGELKVTALLAAGGAATSTGAVALTTAISLAAAGSATATATGALTTAIQVAASAAAASTGAAVLTKPVTVEASGAALATGNAALTKPVTFVASGAGLATGGATLRVTPVLSGSATATATASAALTTAIPLAASGAALATATPTLTTQIQLAPQAAAGQATAAAGLTTAIPLTASASAVATAQANLAGGAVLAADATAQATASGSLTTAITLAASGSALATASGTLRVTPVLSGAATATATSGAALTTAITLSGAASASAAASGTLTVEAALVAQGAASATATASLSTAIVAVASGAAQASATGELKVTPVLAASGSATATASAALVAGASLQASAAAQAAAGAALSTAISLAPSGAALAAASAALQTAITLAAAASASSAGNASLTVDTAFASSGSAQATGTSSLTTQIRVVAAGAASATGSAELTLTGVAMSLAPAAASATSGAGLSTAISLGAAASSSASATASLETSIAIVASGSALAAGVVSLTTAISLAAAATASALTTGNLTSAIALAPAASGQSLALASLTTSIQIIASGLGGSGGIVYLTADPLLSPNLTRDEFARDFQFTVRLTGPGVLPRDGGVESRGESGASVPSTPRSVAIRKPGDRSAK